MYVYRTYTWRDDTAANPIYALRLRVCTVLETILLTESHISVRAETYKYSVALCLHRQRCTAYVIFLSVAASGWLYSIWFYTSFLKFLSIARLQRKTNDILHRYSTQFSYYLFFYEFQLHFEVIKDFVSTSEE